MAVLNIPPNSGIRNLGRLPGTIHIYNTGNPGGAVTTYSMTIIDVGIWEGVRLTRGDQDSYQANGNATYLKNDGPSRLQVLYVGADELEDSDVEVVSEFPS